MKNRYGRSILAAAVAQALSVGFVQANPTGPSVAHGSASLSTSGKALTVTTAPGTVLNWQSFSIGAGELTRFQQSSALSAVLNRVVGRDPSSILGALSSNGRVFLVNPQGIVFGRGAVIDTAGFVASTLNIADQDFLAGRLKFEGGGNGVLRNEGAIRASGDIFLVGPRIENAGLIRSDAGSVLLAAGRSVTITSPDAQGVQFALQAPTDAALNLGSIEAKNAAGMFASTLRHSGDIRANRVTFSASGEAILDAGSNVAASGAGASVLVWSDDTARVHGAISAKGADGKGGFVETSARKIDLNGVRVDTGGGLWLIDPNDFTIAASGGNMTGADVNAALASNNFTIATATMGSPGSGDINVNDAVSWSANTFTLTADRDINVNAVVTAFGTSALAMNTTSGSVKVGMTGSGFLGRVDFPGRSGAGFLTINGNGFTVIDSLGAQGSTTATDLQGMNGNLAGYYALGGNIDATATSGWNAGAGFDPIGTNATPFTGQFNGLGHTIGNLTVNWPTYSVNIGLFGVGAGAVANVGLTGGNVSGKEVTGGLMGRNDGVITNAYSTASVVGTENTDMDSYGGLVGRNFGVISNAFSTGSVSGDYSVGGLVGRNSGTIVDSYSSGAATGYVLDGYGDDIGGLVGSNSGTITNSYATGSVTGSSRIGGLVGNSSGGNINGSYAIGSVTSGSNYAGGLVGFSNNSGMISNSYATGSVNGSGMSWYVGGLVGYSESGTITNSYATGSVTGGDSIGGLVGNNAGGNISGSYATGNVTGGSDVGGLVGRNTDAYATGGNITNAYATGAVNGAGNHIGGLVGYNAPGSTITTSHATGAVTADNLGQRYIGGLAGQNDGTIADSYSTAEVQAFSYAGGLVGYNDGAISGSYSTGVVTTVYQFAGGIAGYNDIGASISTSYSTAYVRASEFAGGLAAWNTGAIADSYNTGNINGLNGSAGGVVGVNEGPGSITRSYSAGSVTGTSNTGGLVGWFLGGTVTNSYWDTQTSGQSASPGGGTGLTTAQMQTAATFGPSGANWNTAVWQLANGAYPALGAAVPVASCAYGACWTGSASGDWSLASNWFGSHLPASGDSVFIDAPGLITVTYSGASTSSLGSLVSNENFTLNSSGGGITVSGATTFGAGTTFTLASGTATFDGITSLASLDLQGGTLSGSGAITLNGTASTWSAGSIAGSGSMSMPGAAALALTGAGARILNGRTLDYGAFTLPGGSLDVQAGALNTTGTTTIGSGATLIASGGAISSALPINVQGTLRTGSGSVTAPDVVVAASGLLTGGGAVSANVSNNGTVAPGNSAGTLTVNGNYIQGAGGTLDIELDGATAGQYDVLAVSGTATLNGAVSFRGAAASGSFPFLTASSISGALASQTGTLSPTLTYNASDITARLGSLSIFWDGDGSDGLWVTPANWSGDALPTSTDDVTIGASAGTVTLASGAHSVNSLQCDANFALSGGARLTLSDRGRFNAGLELNAGTTLTSQGTLDLNTYTLGAGAKVNLTRAGAGVLTIGGLPYTVINSLGAAGSTTGLDLQGMAGNLAGRYASGSDIDASATAGWNSGTGFAPVGALTTGFTGAFDGLGHTISGLAVNRPSTNYVGLFGYANGATIRNVGLAGGSVSGNFDVGALAGYNNAGTISDSYATGAVSGTTGVGALAGYNNAGTISNSYATGAVSGTTSVGGLVGANSGTSSTISNSYATGSVSGYIEIGGLVGVNNGGAISNSYATGSVNVIGTANYVGGLVGANSGTSTISNSYATGSVSGNNYVGGLAGFNYGTIRNTYAAGSVSGTTNVGGLAGFNYFGAISNSYATGSVSGTTNVGGLGGSNNGTISNSYAAGSVGGYSGVGGLVGVNNGMISYSYWDTQISGQATSAGGTGLTTAQAMTPSSYTGWDFTNTWWMADGNTRPFLRSEWSDTIVNAHQVQLMSINLGASYTLGANIDASATSAGTGMWGSAGFVPVGNSTTRFTGAFDGMGHTITGLTINRPSTNYVGLFGYANGATIRNVGLVGGSVSGNSDVGGLVGYNSVGTISNSYVTGSVSGNSDVGGLVGHNYGTSSTISNSYATGSVNGSGSYVGGLVGINYYGTISNSCATGSVSGNSDVGGLVGVNYHGTISNSHATGSVSGSGSYVGGLVGVNNSGTISNSYATGSVSGYPAGGLVGSNYGTGTISNAYWDTQTSGLATSAGGTGLTTAQMKTAATFTGAGWDPAVWQMVDGSYPTLRALSPAPACVYGACWIGIASGDWNNAANWYGNHIPSAGNSVFIDAPGLLTISYLGGSTTSLGSLVSNENFTLNSAGGGITVSGTTTFGSGTAFTLTNGTATFDGATSLQTLNLQGGTVNGSGAVTLNGASSNWSGGTMAGGGRTTVAAGATLAISGAGTKTLNARALVNSGTVNWSGTGTLFMNDNAVITNQAGALFDATSDAAINSSSGTSTHIENRGGTFRKSAGAGTSTVFGNGAYLAFVNNAGTVEVQSGTLSIAGTPAHTGTFSAAPGATLWFRGGFHPFGDGTLFTGGGYISAAATGLSMVGTGSGATIAAGTRFDLNGLSVGGSGKLTNQGTLNLAGSTLAGSLDNRGALSVSAGASTVSGGTLDLTSGTLTLAPGATLTKNGGAVNWVSGTLGGSGSLETAGGATFNLSGSGARILNGPTLGLASLTVPAGSLDVQSGALNLTGSLTINSGATLIASGGSIGSATSMSVAGTLRTGAGSVSAPGIAVTSSGVLTGNSSVTGNVTNDGTVAPGNSTGTLTINGNYTQGATGALNIELDGASAGQYDVLAVSGAATLDGTVNFSGAATSGSFPFLTASSVSGTFASQTGALNPTLAYNAASITATLGASGIFWDGGGNDGLWLTPANWNGDALPVSADDVTIGAWAGTVTLASGARTVRSLQCDANFVLTDGASLTLTSSGSFNAGLNLNAGTALTSQGTLNLNTYALGAGAKIDLTRSGTGVLTIGGLPYTVINSLGAAGSNTGLDLQGMSANLAGRYALGGDIDASTTSGWNGGAGFDPVGPLTFTGNFDGLGHTISNLTINHAGTDSVGLFGRSNGNISNVGVAGGSVAGASYVGALVGSNGGTVRNSYASASITGTGDRIGGLAGYNFLGGTIVDSHASGSVTGNDSVGGLVGHSDRTISNSYATGSVSGNGSVGGLVGSNRGGTVSNSYASASVTGTGDRIGGLAGSNSVGGTIVDSHATGSVTANAWGLQSIGGLAGVNGANASIANSYSTGTVSGDSYTGGLVGHNDGSVSTSYATGNVFGSLGGSFAERIGGLVGSNSNRGTIADSYATGNVTATTGKYIGGLAGRNDGAITYSHSTGTVSGDSYTGGLVGFNGGIVAQSYSTGNVTVTGQFAGGLAGYNDGWIGDSYATGGVDAFGDVGGLAGWNDGTITNSYSAGAVTGVVRLGGFAGYNAGYMTNSYWDTTTSGTASGVGEGSPTGATGLPTAQMKTAATFNASGANWSAAVWNLADGAYPRLRSGCDYGACWRGLASGHWSTPRNWFGARVPMAGDSVFIEAPGLITVTYSDAATASLGSLVSNENLTLNSSGGGIVVSGATTFGAGTAFTVAAGTATFNGVTSLDTLAVQGGSVVVQSGTLTLTGLSGVTIAPGGLLTGNGTLTAVNVSNNGTVAPGNSPGALTINGNYFQDAGGTLAVEVGGTTPGSGYDRLTVTGSATLGGTLSVSYYGGFAPSTGNTFDVLTYGSRSGYFAALAVPAGSSMYGTANPSFYRLAMPAAPAGPAGGANGSSADTLALPANDVRALTDQFFAAVSGINLSEDAREKGTALVCK